MANIGMWSSFMIALTPGIALPNLVLSTKTYAESTIGWATILWLIFCINLFFFVPLFYVHQAMRSSRKLQMDRIEPLYRTQVNRFLKDVENGERTEIEELASMLALGEAYDDVTMTSDWPVDYRTVLQVMGSAIFPVLSYLVSYLR
jgi:hypothetical protein